MATKKNTLTKAAQKATDHLFTGSVEQEQVKVKIVEGEHKPFSVKEVNERIAKTAQAGRQDQKPTKSSGAVKDAEKAVSEPKGRRMTGKGKKIDDTKVFSFRGWKDEVDYWRLYAAVKGLKIDELGSAAINEYIKRHPVTGAESDLQSALQQVRSRK